MDGIRFVQRASADTIFIIEAAIFGYHPDPRIPGRIAVVLKQFRNNWK